MKITQVLENLTWAIKYVLEYNKKYVVVFFVKSIISAIQPLVSIIILRDVINILQERNQTLKILITLICFLFIFNIISECVLNLINEKIKIYNLDFDKEISANILRKSSRLEVKFFESSETYDLINRARLDTNNSIISCINLFFSILSLFVSTISFGVIIWTYSPIYLIIMSLMPIVRYKFENEYNMLEYDIVKDNTERDRKSTYIEHLILDSEYYKEIKLFNSFKYFIDKFNKLKIKNLKNLSNLYNKRIQVFNILSIIESIIDMLITAQLVINTFIGEVLIGTFVSYNNSIDNFKQNIVSIFSQISALYKYSAMLDRSRIFFDLNEEDINKEGIEIKKIEKISLKNVSYKYDKTSNIYALRNINLSVSKKEMIVIMGFNGSGKSTLMKILMGLYMDYEGEIYINDINLKNINLKSYRELISVLFQNYIKYELTIKENIIVSNLEQSKNIDKINKHLNETGFNCSKIELNNSLGYQFTNGRQLSGGEWQKLAISRANFKNADMYIYDEPNSSLDLISEDLAISSIIKNTSNFKIIILHRFNKLINQADRIIVLENGSIKEAGTHEELLLLNGRYKEFFDIDKDIS